LKEFKQGEHVFKEGDNSDYFYCILKGKISIRIEKFNKVFKYIDKEKILKDEDYLENVKNFYKCKSYRKYFI